MNSSAIINLHLDRHYWTDGQPENMMPPALTTDIKIVAVSDQAAVHRGCESCPEGSSAQSRL